MSSLTILDLDFKKEVLVANLSVELLLEEKAFLNEKFEIVNQKHSRLKIVSLKETFKKTTKEKEQDRFEVFYDRYPLFATIKKSTLSEEVLFLKSRLENYL